MRVVIVGGGVAGLGAALAVASAGPRDAEVVVLERDRTPAAADAAGAFAWNRRGAPQVRHSHAFLARLRNLLLARAPSVLDALLAAGATEIRFTDALPETLTDLDPRPGDEQLVALACRRTTFEWVLRACVAEQARVRLVDDVVVDGVVVDGSHRHDGPPRVTGVRLASGDTIAADLVIDASGPRSPSRGWLLDAGVAEPPEEVHDSGIVYLSRFYELRDGCEAPVAAGPVAADVGYLKFAVFVGDNRTFSITLAVDVHDRDLRRAVTDADGFEAAAAQLVAARPWRDGRSVPITDVEIMAGLRNRKRTFVVDGEPVVLGYAAVGDAAICTNPLYGRGCSLALVHAYALADALAAHDDDPVACARAFHDATERELDPWFRAAVLQDQESTEATTWAREAGNGPAPQPAMTDADGTVNPRAWARAVFREGLLPAIRTSPVVFRAFLRWFNLLATPDALITDPEVVQAALASYADRASHPPPEPLGPPTREALLANMRQFTPHDGAN